MIFLEISQHNRIELVATLVDDVSVLIQVFWMIYGSVQVFSISPSYSDSHAEDFCQHGPFTYAYAILVIGKFVILRTPGHQIVVSQIKVLHRERGIFKNLNEYTHLWYRCTSQSKNSLPLTKCSITSYSTLIW